MKDCSSCVHGIKVNDMVQCTHPTKWGALMSTMDSCPDWEGAE